MKRIQVCNVSAISCLGASQRKSKEIAREEKRAEIKREMELKKSGICVAEKIIQEGEKRLQKYLSLKSLKRDDIQKAQSKHSIE